MMRSTFLFFAFTSSIVSTADAISLRKRQSGINPRVVNFDLHRAQTDSPIARDQRRLRRRAGTVDVDIDNSQSLYYFNASLGTPEQDVRLHLDTGSSDLWVNAPDSTLCTARTNPCATSGTYNANDSSTYEFVGSYFNISYVDGSGAAGDYVTDTFNVGNSSITDLQFGVGYESTSTEGILGIGYPSNEVQATRSRMNSYDNLPAKMASEGIIASSAYSLWLNDLEASTGNVLFGGVDREQYEGDLVTLPIQKSSGAYRELFITLTGLNLGSTTLQNDLSLAVLLDSGSSLTYLPDNLTQSIYDMVNAVYEEQEGVAFVPCSLGSQAANMTFKFSDPASISVPISELVLNFTSVTGRQLSFADGVAACMFGIAPAGTGTNVLGDTFMRSAYLVFDLDNNEVSMAQSAFGATGSDIVEIGSGDNSIPSTTDASDPSATPYSLRLIQTFTSNIHQDTMNPYVELTLSWLFRSAKAHDAKNFTTLPAFAEHPAPTLRVTSPDCGADGATLGKEYMHGGEGRMPQLQWNADDVPGVKEWLVVSEDPDAPLPTPICHGIYLGVKKDQTSLTNDDFQPTDGTSTKLKGGFFYGQSRNGSIYIAPRPLLNHGIHRYFYEVIALSEPLDPKFIASKPSREDVGKKIEGKVLAWGHWTGASPAIRSEVLPIHGVPGHGLEHHSTGPRLLPLDSGVSAALHEAAPLAPVVDGRQ
ncbi:hypothetical protein G7046_g8080 [Stylonectria norvegica]|nr:hypothetical protein G7046_g8080 [Stylonectria norvegica]